MARLIDRIFFDRQDRDILVLVNRILEAPNVPSRDNLFNPELHPHGIKELVTFPASRMAYAVINLLRNLEVGGSRDRLLALQTLYDEVLTSAHSALRRNTARALMQIMKDMVRAHGDETRQLMLAHDFRNTALGTPRVVRRMLARYHLPEMPEAWNQLAFDDHAVVVRVLDHLTGQLDVLFQRQMRAVDHNGGEAAVDAGLAGLKIRAVVQMQHDRQIHAALLRVQQRRLDQLHEIHVLGIRTRALGDLENDRRLLHRGRLGDALNDFHVVDVERADGIVAFIRLLKHLGRGNKTH